MLMKFQILVMIKQLNGIAAKILAETTAEAPLHRKLAQLLLSRWLSVHVPQAASALLRIRSLVSEIKLNEQHFLSHEKEFVTKVSFTVP